MQQTITITEGLPTQVPTTVGPVDATEAERGTGADAGKQAAIPATGPVVGGQRPVGFWAEYRARRGERVPRAKLRFAISLAGEGFCRRALASSEPFAKGCAAEAAGTPGGLREALVTLAVAGGRAVAREVARGDVASLEERARGLEVDDARLRSALETVGNEEAVRILEEVISKEPLGPAVREGDDKWYDLVNWVVFATIQAEEFGLSSENIEGAAEDPEFAENPEVLRFLAAGEGDDAAFASGLDLEPDFAVRIVSSVGNYAEIYERNITPLGLDRGLNNLYNADEPGLLYPPPYR